MLTKTDIFAAKHLPAEEVDVPEWGGTVFVRGMTGSERDLYEASLYVDRGGEATFDNANSTAKALVKCIVDAEGNRVFDDRDANELGSQPAAALMRIWRVARRLSGLGPEDVKAAAEDFGDPAGSVSSSTSPNGSASLSSAS